MEKQKRIRIKYPKRLGSFIKGLLPGNRRFSLISAKHTLLSKDKDVETYRFTMEPLYNEVLCITNSFFTPVIVKYMKKNLDITKPCYSEQILPVPSPFNISRFHCITKF